MPPHATRAPTLSRAIASHASHGGTSQERRGENITSSIPLSTDTTTDPSHPASSESHVPETPIEIAHLADFYTSLGTTARTSVDALTRGAGPQPGEGGDVTSNPSHEVTASLRSGEASSLAALSDRDSVISWSDRSMAEENSVIADGAEQPTVAASIRNGLPPVKMDSLLPENDGMAALRVQLHQIRQLAISTEERAMRMHLLMTQDYLARQRDAATPTSSVQGDPTAMLVDEPAALDVGIAALPIDPSNPYNLRPGDTDITYSPLPPSPPHEGELEDSDGQAPSDLPDLGCMHYKRNVKIQCFDCHRWFPCRHCHDQAADLPFPHTLRRKLTRNMLCMLCRTPQPAGVTCMACGEYAAWYYCDECKLWDNDSNKRIYHCDDCGICRVGEGLGKDYVHCKRCGVCISISTSAAHPCIEGATMGDCPLCLDKMFESRSSVVSLPCGHYMHGLCFKDLMAASYRCPVCSKSAVNMELQWRKLDDEIRLQPMPDDDVDFEGLLPGVATSEGDRPQTRRPRNVWIGCNDCSSRCWTPFHWLGLKCQNCDSYNTTQMAPTAGHETEAERIVRQQQIHRHHDFTGLGVWADAGINRESNPTVTDSQQPQLLDIPSSPSHLALPASPGSPTGSGGLPSPRRYFVQEEASPHRRPSFLADTSRAFSTPTLPNYLPEYMPQMPRLPRLPNIPSVNMNLPAIPNLPTMPNIVVPNMPQLDLSGRLPRFSPYGVFDSLSRSLSPMRYYLQGLDMTEEGRASLRREYAEHAMTTRAGGDGKPARMREDLEDEENDAEENEAFWDDEVEEGQVRHRRRGKSSDGDDEDEDENEEESESDLDSDPEAGDDEPGEEEDDEEMDLFGHR